MSLYDYGTRSDGGAHGVVLTRPYVVSFILDLAGYEEARDLGALSLLEPSCGDGAFLAEAASRLIRSARARGREHSSLSEALLGYDVDAGAVERARRAVAEALRAEGVDAPALIEAWIRRGDFLLAGLGDRRFDLVVGNPPYVRIEQLSPALRAEYRRRYSTLYDRADLYVAFIERGLSLLSPGGVLAFICADRWVRNRYGAPLRRLISAGYGLRCYLDLAGAAPFDARVSAYPAIFAVSPGAARPYVARLTSDSPEELGELLAEARGAKPPSRGALYPAELTGGAPWALGAAAQLPLLRALEARLPALEDGGAARVGVGVATGNDAIYVVGEGADIEPGRLLPLVSRADLAPGVARGARYVINTFEDDGAPISLARYPRLARYLARNEAAVRRRHVAKKNPAAWFRTIDRVYPDIAKSPKLLIPDISGGGEVFLEAGGRYPHHNLYYVTSARWDLEVLGGLLCSRVARLFVWSYAVKMRGGYMRFQAQYLRRVRVPRPGSIAAGLSREIAAAFRAKDAARLDALALAAYGLEALPEF
jgi:adenine-specific DNA-methyltransferase